MENKVTKAIAISLTSTILLSGNIAMAAENTTSAREAATTRTEVTTESATGVSTEIAGAGIATALENYYKKADDVSTADTQITKLLTPTTKETSTKVSAPETAETEQTSTTKKTTSYLDEKNTYFDHIAISQVTSYVNVRSDHYIESDVVGKIYGNCGATIEDEYEGWYKIKSGNVTGWVSSLYFITGTEAEEYAAKNGYVLAKVDTQTLNLREKKTTNSSIVTQLAQDTTYAVKAYNSKWARVVVDDNTWGYVSMKYINISAELPTAKTLEEDAADQAAAQEAAEAAYAAEQSSAEEAYAAEQSSAEAAYEEALAQSQAAEEAAQASAEAEEASVAAEAAAEEASIAEAEAQAAAEQASMDAEQSEAAEEQAAAQSEAASSAEQASVEAEQASVAAESKAAEAESMSEAAAQSEAATEAPTEAYTSAYQDGNVTEAQTQVYTEPVTQSIVTTTTQAYTDPYLGEDAYEVATQAPTTTTTAAVTEQATTAADTTSNSGTSGSAVVNYAMQFLGNPYVYGGSSLTNGTDCSGFTMSIFAHFGYYLDRTSSAQRYNGVNVSIDSVQPGDIICYSGHVAIYIGNGQIIHASTPATGIMISPMYYGSTPICARRIIQ